MGVYLHNYIDNYNYMVNSTKIYVQMNYCCISHFFELVRFDFVIDSELKVWLMEVGILIVS